MRKSATKEKKKVKFSDGDSRREYAQAVAKEKEEEDEGVQRESPITGGSRASSDEPGVMEQEEGDHDDEFDEGRNPEELASPEGPSKHERETHNLTHIPFRSWCEHCVKGRARKKAHKKRNPEIKKEELKKATRIYMDFYYNGIGEKEEEREEDEGVANNEEEVEADSPSIILYD